MDVLRELMPVVDSMDAAVKAAEKWDDAEHGKDFADGMALIMDQWTKALEKLGVEEIPGEGSTFDPAYTKLWHTLKTTHMTTTQSLKSIEKVT